MEETESHSPNRSISSEICLPGIDNSSESPDNSASEQEPIPSPMTSINRVLELLDPTEFSFLSRHAQADEKRRRRGSPGPEARVSAPRLKAAKPVITTRGDRKCKLIDFSSQLTAGPWNYPIPAKLSPTLMALRRLKQSKRISTKTKTCLRERVTPAVLSLLGTFRLC